MTEIIQPIPARLKNVAVGGHVAGAADIIDEIQQKDQKTINSELIQAVGTGGSVDSRIAAAVNALDSTKLQSAGADGLALSITEEDGKITSISGSIAPNTYDAYGAASTVKTELLGDAASDYNTLGKLEDKIQAEASRAEGAESALDGRVDTLEENVAYLGENDGSAVVANFDPQTDTVWKKAQTLSAAEKEQIQQNIGVREWLNNLTGEKFASYTATSQTTAATDVLPASGATDTVYRVGKWDGSAYNEEYYSDYAWDGSAYVQLNKKSIVGEVFDISEYHAGAKYVDLAAALDSNNGGGVPQSLQKGGMSVKFVSNSDNKYVQFRYMSTSTAADFTNVSNWQGVDDKLIPDSKNLIECGVVAELNTFELKYNDAIKSGASVAFLRTSSNACMQVIPIKGFQGKVGFRTYAAYNAPYNQYPTKAVLLVNTEGDSFEIVAVTTVVELIGQQSGSGYTWYSYITDLTVEPDKEYYLLIDIVGYVYPASLDAENKANWRAFGAVQDSELIVGTTLTAGDIVTNTYLLYYPFVIGRQVITIDNEVLEGSTNPVSGNAVYNAILGIGTNTKWNNKTGNFIGDSLTDSTQYTAILTELYGIQKALPGMAGGGTGYSRYPNSGNPFYHRLDYINLNCDFISVLGGTNDWSTNCPLGDKTDTDDSSFYGCVYQFYYKLRQKFPSKPVFVFTIPQRNTTTLTGQPSGIDTNGLGLSIAQYNDAIRYMAERYGCLVFDSWESGIIVDNILTYTTDGLHFNTLGSERFARFTKMKYETVEPSMFV